MDLHLLEVNIRACAYVKDVIDGSTSNLKTGVEADQGKLMYCFKIVGENRLVAVLDGGVESAVAALSGAYGDQTDIACSPLRTYETFASHVLGLSGPLVTRPTKRPIPEGPSRMYWLQFNLEYRGKSAADLISIWYREAKSILSMREKGELQFDLFKVAGKREVHMFIAVPDSEFLDDIVFTLPIMKDLGDQVTVNCKSIISLTV